MLAGLSLGLITRPDGAAIVPAAFVGAGISLVATASYVLYRFYRDPERSSPVGEEKIVSPADGEVIYVHRSRAGELPVPNKHGRPYTLVELTRTSLQSEDAVVIGIAMNFLDVHVNRTPISGRVTLQRHFPGRFGSLRRSEMVYENERATTVIEGNGMQVAVVQIASRLVRQIVAFVAEGEEVVRGSRLGVIRLGSQVDLVLPARPDLVVHVSVGDRVRAGESVLATVRADSAPTTQDPAIPATASPS